MIVNASWLKKNINKKNIKIIDASWYLPNSKRDGFTEYLYSRIPNAVFFDIDRVSKKNTSLPHMLPNVKVFEAEVSKLGIFKKDTIIIYCKDGINSSPRVWWTFKYFGHKKVYVLNGGFRAWKLVNGKIEKHKKYKKVSSYKSSRLNKNLLIHFSTLKKIIRLNKEYIIIDVRPANRFNEKEPEPRVNVGKGSIPESINIPHYLLQQKGFLKLKLALKDILKKINLKNKFIVCSCGSGVSACNLAMALNYVGISNYKVYDGSWTEWYLKTKN